MRAHEALIHEAERDGKFARRVRESAQRVLAFKSKRARVTRDRRRGTHSHLPHELRS